MRAVATLVLCLPVCVFAAPVFHVAETDGGIAVTVDVGAAELITTERDGTPYAAVALDGTTGGEAGEPDLPAFSRFIAVPAGRRAEIEAMYADARTRKLAKPLVHAESRPGHCGEEPAVAERDDESFARARNRPFARLSPTSHLGAARVALLTIAPVQLKSETRVRIASRLHVMVRFAPEGEGRPSPVAAAGISDDMVSVYRSLVLNPTDLPGFSERSATKVDLILADASYAAALGELVRFKQGQGREVRVKLFEQPPSTDDVKAIIATEYAAPHPPTHTILVGSIDQIPAFRRSNYWTDYPYALLDAGEYPDASIARLPVQSEEELRRLVAKIVARETEARNDGTFLVASGADNARCRENLQFIQDDILAGGGGPLPLNVEELASSDVAGAFEANPNVVIYDGHGDSTGMTEIPFVLEQLEGLRNTAFPLVFDTACRNAYWPASGAGTRNFAESLAVAEAGAAGILAASAATGGHELLRDVLRGVVRDEEPFDEVGTAVLYGKLKALERQNANAEAVNDNYVFFYLGDPASTVFAKPARTLVAVE